MSTIAGRQPNHAFERTVEERGFGSQLRPAAQLGR